MLKYRILAICPAIMLLASCQSQVSVEQHNKAVVRRYLDELLNGRNYAIAHEIITPGFTLCAGDEILEPRGVEFFKQNAESTDKVLSKIELVHDEMIAEGNTVAVRWHDVVVHDRGEFSGYEVDPTKRT